MLNGILSKTDLTIKTILIVLISLILPFFLIILEKNLLPYPEFVEEIAKGAVVLLILAIFYSFKQRLLVGLLFGLLFGSFENILYLPNVINANSLDFFGERMLIVTPMHILTTLIMVLVGCVNKWYFIFGLIGAIIIHLLFNNIMIGFII